MERGADWYKREPIAFLDGVQGLGPELIGVYAVILDLMYSRSGDIPRDDRHLSGILGCSKRKAKSLTDKLIDTGKISSQGNLLSNSRAKEEAKSKRELSEKRASAGRKGGKRGAQSRKNNDLAEANAEAKVSNEEIREEEIREEENDISPENPSVIDSLSDSNDGFSSDQACQAIELYRQTALQVGLPEPLETFQQIKQVKAILREHGFEQWRVVIDKVSASPFLQGKSGLVSWTGATLDWISKPSNFEKTLEGQYDKAGKGNRETSGTVDRVRRLQAEAVDRECAGRERLEHRRISE